MKQTELIFEKENLILTSPEETAHLALEFAAQLKPGDTVAFFGNLGTGKTFFIKQICAALQTEEEATSPSFTIINEYHTREGLKIVHVDFYRLESDAELQNLGLDEFLYNDNICLIEWAGKIQSFLPAERYDVFIRFVEGNLPARKIDIYRREKG